MPRRANTAPVKPKTRAPPKPAVKQFDPYATSPHNSPPSLAALSILARIKAALPKPKLKLKLKNAKVHPGPASRSSGSNALDRMERGQR